MLLHVHRAITRRRCTMFQWGLASSLFVNLLHYENQTIPQNKSLTHLHSPPLQGGNRNRYNKIATDTGSRYSQSRVHTVRQLIWQPYEMKSSSVEENRVQSACRRSPGPTSFWLCRALGGFQPRPIVVAGLLPKLERPLFLPRTWLDRSREDANIHRCRRVLGCGRSFGNKWF